jgi:CDP-glycerol glycerophosphotransferase
MRVVYNSFQGRFSDNPRALYERLRELPGTEHVWLLDPAHAASFPLDVETVRIDGPGARAVLESADLVVAGTHTEVEWCKPAGTRYLQTWHGTPLKRVHRDVLWAPPGRLDRLDRDIARWDVLLSPNPVSTARLRRAFGFEKEVWETGYPRNDLLLSPEAGQVRDAVRRALEVPEDATVVLYAPTWRDDEGYGESASIPMHVDLPALASRLGEGDRRHVVLARAHNLVTGRLQAALGPGVVDASWHRDIRELYLAADVLVTDYSSVMFDFSLTGKPMVFFAYDLERYRDELRGFYFDLLPVAPGPVVADADALVEAVLRAEDDRERYAARYARFRATYGVLEDGRATQRVLARLGL